MKSKISKPFYKASKSFISQVDSGVNRSSQNVFKFILKKSLNYLLAMLAYNCPINSWRIKLHRMRGVKIGSNVMIGFKVILDYSYPDFITIEDNVSLAGNNYILAHSNPYPHFENVLESYVAPVTIKSGAWLGIGSIILPDITIGKNSVVAAGSVVIKNVPDSVIVGGNPAKIIKEMKF